MMKVPKPFYMERNGRVFVIGPIGEEGSEKRKLSDDILKYMIEPAAEKCGFKEVLRADLLAVPGEITRQIIEHLIEDDLVIADLREHNPNVFYELGVRHSTGKPCIQIADKAGRLPFDLFVFRTIFYENNVRSFDNAKEELIKQIEFISKTPEPTENLVSVSFEMLKMRRSQNMIDIISLLEPTRATRHLIREKRSQGKTWKDLSNDELKEVDELCRRFDMLGLYDRLGLINSLFVDLFYSVPLVELYETFLSDYVNYLRDDSKRGKTHFWELVKLYERVKYVPSNHPAITGNDDWPDNPRAKYAI
jgi:hypothetical protein